MIMKIKSLTNIAVTSLYITILLNIPNKVCHIQRIPSVQKERGVIMNQISKPGNIDQELELIIHKPRKKQFLDTNRYDSSIIYNSTMI